jgi:3-oxoadipate CoA-transferase beta subunit
MDLAIGAKDVFVMMTLFDRSGRSKLVPQCSYPLTGVRCVSRVYTDVATFQITRDALEVSETFGITLRALRERVAVLQDF